MYSPGTTFQAAAQNRCLRRLLVVVAAAAAAAMGLMKMCVKRLAFHLKCVPFILNTMGF